MLTKISVFILAIGTFAFGARRLLSYLRYFQQEEYNAHRFTGWLKHNRAFDSRGSLTLLAALLVGLLLPYGFFHIVFAAAASLTLGVVAYLFEEDPRTSGKLKLNMTQRARKIYAAAAALLVVGLLPLVILGCCSSISSPALFSIACILACALVQSPPWLLMAANELLSPFEKNLQQRFVDDAKSILAEVNPFVIGITGSYGKTGAKAALGDLLHQCVAPTFWPKKSINTVMGITRTIREELKPYHRYAVIEMGAYNVGSINRLCAFTPPKAALVTAVGIMHLERFGSEENVYRAKSELPQAVPQDGILVCNGDNPGARRMAKEYDRSKTLLYGIDLGSGHLDCYATNLSFDEQGSTFVIHWNGAEYPARTPLLGRPAVSNILGAFTMACALGADPDYATACLASLQPVDNRLVLDKSGKLSFLRDAYNSNPTGFSAALEVLGTLHAERRILITPGMIELGNRQYEENRRVATLAAGVCDLIIVVGRTNRDAFVAGLDDARFDKDKVRIVENRDDAFSLLRDEQRDGDLILIENDLPDLHENNVRF